MTNSIPSPSSHKYRTSYYTRYLAGAVGLAFLGLCFLLLTGFSLATKPQGLTDWRIMLATGLIGILCLVTAVLGPYGESKTSLITSPEGIEYRGMGFRVFTDWENVERVDIIPLSRYSTEPKHTETVKLIEEKAPWLKKLEQQFPENHQECLVLRKSVRYEKNRFARRMIRNETQFIPMNEFPWWRNGALGQDILKYSPHLAEKSQG